ncbi:hypothetical protein Tco_1184436 [Tanacetum coccineum]
MHRSSPTFLSRIRFKHDMDTSNFPTCFVVIRGGETVSNSVFKHDLCKLVIAKMGFAITYDSTRGTESGKERFKKFANNSGVERPHEIDAPYVKDFANLDGILRHFITLRNFSLTLTSVTSGDQVMGISDENPAEQSRHGIIFSKEIFRCGVEALYTMLLVQVRQYTGILTKKDTTNPLRKSNESDHYSIQSNIEVLRVDVIPKIQDVGNPKKINIIPFENLSRGVLFQPKSGGTLERNWEKHNFTDYSGRSELHRRIGTLLK